MTKSLASETSHTAAQPKPPLHPFRRAVLRGMAIVMPPLLTIVLFIWAWSMIDGYVLRPIESGVNFVIRKGIEQVRDGIPSDVPPELIGVLQDGEVVPLEQLVTNPKPYDTLEKRVRSRGGEVVSFQSDGLVYVHLNNEKWIPETVWKRVKESPGDLQLASASPSAVYRRYVQIVWLPRWRVIPVFLLFFVGALYFLGKFMAFGVGRITWNTVEALIRRVPVIRNVYSSVKQVTDFVFSEQEVQFTRVVAVQYPSKGIWSLGFVTGESMLDIRSAANEPVLSVLIPTSPMPATGFTITVRKSETIDLDISMDQAIQFIVSCGVVVPGHQMPALAKSPATAQLAATIQHRIAQDRGQEDDGLRPTGDE